MRGPKPPMITLSPAERQGLATLVRRHPTAQQVALRARMVLAAADGLNNAQIAPQVGVDVDTARRWRQRWLGCQAVRLEDLPIADRLTAVPRPGRPAELTAAQVGQMVALACEAPSLAGRPISPWTGREIAEAVMGRGIVAQISPRHASRLLQKGISNRTFSATG